MSKRSGLLLLTDMLDAIEKIKLYTVGYSQEDF